MNIKFYVIYKILLNGPNIFYNKINLCTCIWNIDRRIFIYMKKFKFCLKIYDSRHK